MEIYLDSLDSFYTIKHEPEPKQNKDYAGTGAIIFTFSVMSIVIGLSIYTAWQIAFGYQEASGNTANNNSLVIRNNDMEPQLKPYDTVMYSNLTLFDNLKVGDIIVFRAPEAKTEDGKPKVIVHRVVEIGNFFENRVIRTKGDANTYSIPGIDYPIFRENYIGKFLSVTHNNNTAILAVDNQTEPRSEVDNQTEPRSRMNCYMSWVGWSFIANALLPIHVDISDPDIKQLFLNLCDNYHEKTGIWNNILTDSQIETNTTNEDLLKYYPNGIPDSVKELCNQITSFTGNGTK